MTTLYFQRRNQHRATLSEIGTPAAIAGDDQESTENICLKKQAEAEIVWDSE